MRIFFETEQIRALRDIESFMKKAKEGKISEKTKDRRDFVVLKIENNVFSIFSSAYYSWYILQETKVQDFQNEQKMLFFLDLKQIRDSGVNLKKSFCIILDTEESKITFRQFGQRKDMVITQDIYIAQSGISNYKAYLKVEERIEEIKKSNRDDFALVDFSSFNKGAVKIIKKNHLSIIGEEGRVFLNAKDDDLVYEEELGNSLTMIDKKTQIDIYKDCLTFFSLQKEEVKISKGKFLAGEDKRETSFIATHIGGYDFVSLTA